MGYKFKPNKGVKKRVKVSKTGKIKHRHEMNSHLRSGRSPALKRRLGRSGVLAEGQASRMRTLLGIRGVRPAEIAHERALAAKEETAANKTPACSLQTSTSSVES